MNVRAIATGALTLICLEVVLSSKNTGALPGLLQLPAQLARRLVDPTVPAIPDLTKH